MRIKTVFKNLLGIIVSPRRSIPLIIEQGKISTAIVIVLVSSVINVSWSFCWQNLGKREFSPSLYILTELFLPIFSYLASVGLLHLSSLLFNGRGSFKSLFTVIGYIYGAIFAIRFVVLTILLVGSSQSAWNFFAHVRSAIGLVTLFWHFALWAVAVRNVYRLSIARSMYSTVLTIVILFPIRSLFIYKLFLIFQFKTGIL